MQGTKPVTFSPVSHSNPTQLKPRIFSKRIKSTYLGITIETTVKLFTNIVISVCVTSAFLKLWPHYQSIQEKLQVIESEIEATTERLDREKADFSRYFDPSQAKSIMQEQSNLVDRHQIPIIWLEDNVDTPGSKDAGIIK
ncbi:hypothetical protein [Okeania sp. KiyG1]|uniref:slr1601 family putative cell division protein n=1 Tax=Okeania sp. KiyG1 TaxID=2720165 RepID=UPI0019226DDF|nr:hypothetical protein [Okeania sp. KiyG1]GGA33631.1 hypothetical protein CYANOKiyG1_50690 [Okeania sp. KiyG1]